MDRRPGQQFRRGRGRGQGAWRRGFVNNERGRPGRQCFHMDRGRPPIRFHSRRYCASYSEDGGESVRFEGDERGKESAAKFGSSQRPDMRRRRMESMNISSRITPYDVRNLSQLKPNTLVKRVDSQLKEFQQALNVMEVESVCDIVVILQNIVDMAKDREGAEQSAAIKIIAEILNSERCAQFHFHLNKFIKGSACNVKQVEDLCILFHDMLIRFESIAWECLPIDELYETVKRLANDDTKNDKLIGQVKELCETRDEIRNLHTMENNEDFRDNTKYKNIPVLPHWEEIMFDKGKPHDVVPNKVAGPYKDWMEYYDIQFHLIREDFIAPLRRGVAAFLNGDWSRHNSDVKVYRATRITSQLTTKRKGICFCVQFDVKEFCKVNWEHNKRLIFGSLLCFIPIEEAIEKTILFGMVADRNIKNLQKGKTLIEFNEDYIVRAMDHQKNGTVFVMVESTSYFAAVSPILQSLKNAEVETMPFTKELIKGECDQIPPPNYLSAMKDGRDNVSYNLSCLHGATRKSLHVLIFDEKSWETAKDSELDSSQLNAIRSALTQEIAVIQGPPGTGKTYIGLKIVEALLENRRVWDPCKTSPILVMCYTNHALDQFLEQIVSYCKEVIRVGGRCQSEKMEPYKLKNIRKNNIMDVFSEDIGSIIGELHSCNPYQVLKKVIQHHKRTSFLPLNIIRKVAKRYHCFQLKEIAQDEELPGREVEIWLDIELAGKDSQTVAMNNSTKHAYLNSTDRRASHDFTHLQANTDASQNSKKSEFIDIRGDAILTEEERLDDEVAEGYKVLKSPYEQDCKQGEGEESSYVTVNRKVGNVGKFIKGKLFKARMSKHEAEEVDDIMDLSIKDRWRLYNYWENERYKYLQDKNRKLVEEYNEKCKELAALRQEEDRYILERASVIGMTTTGAAKYQHILQDIKPKIVIVEEAAEILEAHIVSALSAGTQHLILIGDHKQLRPKPNEHVLATKFNLSISLFERLVMKGMSQATLEIQHRMRPEIAGLVCPHVYEKLVNHESVTKYPEIRGISKNMYFICHTEPESENQAVHSHENEFEAKYIVALCGHLLKLGYRPSQITILTPYVGQLLNLRNKMPKKEFEGVRVLAIDNFQGEESDIILFSMVRSTNPKSSRTTIGFVREDNRVCVSLSRAKQGFYAIGNFELIRHQTPLWESIISDVESRDCYGDALPLYCCNHPETKYSAKKDTDFITNAPNGGCKEIICNIRLPCGHSCMETCHGVHSESYKCRKMVERTLECGHTQQVPCYDKDPTCTTICSNTITCQEGHTCKRRCHYPQSCGSCLSVVTITCQKCSKGLTVPCGKRKCTYPCESILSCGHICKKKCGETCETTVCKEDVSIDKPCGHIISTKCYKKHYSCSEQCLKILKCGHQCSGVCGSRCITKCETSVEKELPCGHTIKCKCYRVSESDLTCRRKVEKHYPCGHSAKIPCSSNAPCRKICGAILICGHRCSGKCSDCFSTRIHPLCPFNINIGLFSSHLVTIPCAGLSDSLESDNTVVPCSHREDFTKCLEECSWDCKHYNCERECGEVCKRQICNEPCDKILYCGHICPGICGERCITHCPQCDYDKFIEMFYPKPKSNFMPKNGTIIELKCGHVLLVSVLDEIIMSRSSSIKVKECPKCLQCIAAENRYGNKVKCVKDDIEAIRNLIMSQRVVSESENDNLSNLDVWVNEEFLFPWFRNDCFTTIKIKLDSDVQVTLEESYFIQCANSFSLLNEHLKPYYETDMKDIIDDLISTVVTLILAIERSEVQNYHFKMVLSRQLIDDCMSELYRLALTAQCTISTKLLKQRNVECTIGESSNTSSCVMSTSQPGIDQTTISENETANSSESQLTRPDITPSEILLATQDGETTNSTNKDFTLAESVIESVMHYIASLHPLRDRIAETEYEEHFHKICSVFPTTSHIHVNTPHIPAVVKGTWMKCSSGHYYCVTPFCGVRTKLLYKPCPECKE